MFGSLMMRCLAVTLCVSVASAQTVGFISDKSTWTTAAAKEAAYLTITFTGTAPTTSHILYIVDVDHDGGCGASDNEGKILAKIDSIAEATPTCGAGKTAVTFEGNWKGCEVTALTYQAPTLTDSDVHRIRLFLSTESVNEPANNARTPLNAGFINTLTTGASTTQADICFKSGTTAPVTCTCEASAAVEIDSATKNTWTKTADKSVAYGTINLTGATNYTMYIIDVDASMGCGRTGNTGYIHGIVRNLKMSEADGVTACASGTTRVELGGNAFGCEDNGVPYASPAPPANTDEHTYKIYVTNKVAAAVAAEPSSDARDPATDLITLLGVANSGNDVTTSTSICFDNANSTPLSSCACTYTPPITVGFTNGIAAWTPTAAKAAAFAEITFSGTLTGYRLYIIDVDHDGGCGASDNAGKILSVVDNIMDGTPTCGAGKAEVTFDGTWKGCEVTALAYEAPTLTGDDVHRIRLFLSTATTNLPSNNARTPLNADDNHIINALMTGSTTKQTDICFKNGESAKVECTCTASAAVAIDTGSWNKNTVKADAYKTITVTGALDDTLYFIDTHARFGCGNDTNLGYIHGIVRNLKMSEADGVDACPSGHTRVELANNAFGCEDDNVNYVAPGPEDGTNEHTYKIYVTNKSPAEPTNDAREPATDLLTALDATTTGTESTVSADICFEFSSNAAVTCNCSYVAPSSSTTATVTVAPTTTSGAFPTSMSVASTIFAGVCLARA